MQKVIDLRSDTVTKPTPEMREAMKNAVVGDDILRDDPTVIELEELAADIFGKEASLLTVSGTMSNEIAIMVYAKPGDEIIVSDKSKNSAFFKDRAKTISDSKIPGWLDLDVNNLNGKVLAVPTREDIDFTINEQLIVEFYSR